MSIIYVITHEQASGLITARDFINLSAYKCINNMHILGGKACEHEDMPVKETYIRYFIYFRRIFCLYLIKINMS